MLSYLEYCVIPKIYLGLLAANAIMGKCLHIEQDVYRSGLLIASWINSCQWLIDNPCLALLLVGEGSVCFQKFR